MNLNKTTTKVVIYSENFNIIFVIKWLRSNVIMSLNLLSLEMEIVERHHYSIITFMENVN